MYAILDIETTGGKYNEEGITEIAIYKHDGREVVDRFISLINPERPVQPFVVGLTGIDNEMLRSAPKFYEVAKTYCRNNRQLRFSGAQRQIRLPDFANRIQQAGL